ELTPNVHQLRRSTWAPLDVSPDGRSVYALSDEGDTPILMHIDAASGRVRTLLSFANSSAPVAVDAAQDGSLYLDQLMTPFMMLRVPASGGAPDEFYAGSNTA